MEYLALLLILLSMFGFALGLIRPSTVWMPSRERSALVFGVAIIVSFVLFGVTSSSPTPASAPATALSMAPVAATSPVASTSPSTPTHAKAQSVVEEARAMAPSAHPVQAAAPQPAPVTVPAASWHTVITYGNNTHIQTPAFAMHGSRWRVTYSCQANADVVRSGIGGQFYGQVRSADDGSMANDFASFVECPHSDTSYIYGEIPGQYYLDLNQANGSYTVSLEDYY